MNVALAEKMLARPPKVTTVIGNSCSGHHHPGHNPMQWTDVNISYDCRKPNPNHYKCNSSWCQCTCHDATEHGTMNIYTGD